MNCSDCQQDLSENAKFCENCGKKVLQTKISEKDKVTFPIFSKWRLIVFSILSFGLYSVYWFAKYFQAIEPRRRVRGKKTKDILLGIFNSFTSGILFYELDSIKKEGIGTPSKLHPALSAILYFLFMFFGRFFLLSPIVFIIVAFKIQAQVKYFEKLDLVKTEETFFNWRDILISVIGALFLLNGFIN